MSEEVVKTILEEEKLSVGKSVLDEIEGCEMSIGKKLRGEGSHPVFLDEDLDKASKLVESFMDKEDLANQILDSLPMHYDTSGIWQVWKGSECRWEMKDDVDILNLVRFASPANIVNSKERTEILTALKQEARIRKPEPLKPTIIQFGKEIIDLETGERKEATPSYATFNPIPWNIGSSKETPTIDRVFEEWVGKDHVKMLYEIIAFCMIPDYPLNRIFCFIGSGSNGKSCYLNLLRKFIGDKNVCSTELDVLLKSRFEVTKLHKKLVCQMGETNFGEMSKTSMLKKLSGNDLIGFEYKNKTPFEAKNYAKILIATNNLPSTTDKTIGFYRRWVIIDFPNQFSEKKDILSEIPDAEFENLANKCVGLIMDVLKNREFTNEGSVEERMKRYEEKSNFLDKFLSEYTEEKLDCYITKAEFYRKFSDWTKSNRHRNISEIALGKEMKHRNIPEGRKHLDWLYDGKGGTARIWMDLRWKE